MSYEIRQRVVKKSKPQGNGFSKQRVVWDLLYNGKRVRTFKRQEWAVQELARRGKRRDLLADARDEAAATGQPVTVKRRGQSPITVSFAKT